MNNIVGVDELSKVPFLAGEKISAPEIPFSQQVLDAHADTHICIYTPRIAWLTLNGLRAKFGTDPDRSEPCMYNQDWYVKEKFANETLDDKWHLVRKDVLENARAKQPDQIESALSGESFPAAITCAFTFFAWWSLRGETLWKNDFVWCADRDHNGDRIYVGRYEDSVGVNKNGFNIHRYLTLQLAYSAAPEVRQ